MNPSETLFPGCPHFPEAPAVEARAWALWVMSCTAGGLLAFSGSGLGLEQSDRPLSELGVAAQSPGKDPVSTLPPVFSTPRDLTLMLQNSLASALVSGYFKF